MSISTACNRSRSPLHFAICPIYSGFQIRTEIASVDRVWTDQQQTSSRRGQRSSPAAEERHRQSEEDAPRGHVADADVGDPVCRLHVLPRHGCQGQ